MSDHGFVVMSPRYGELYRGPMLSDAHAAVRKYSGFPRTCRGTIYLTGFAPIIIPYHYHQ